jgi:hypothetical protein
VSVVAVLLVAVTFYQPTGNPTITGDWPRAGTAGCSADIPLGTVLAFEDGRTVVCDDRGDDGFMAPHVDVFCAGSFEDCLDAIPAAGDWHERQPATVLRWGP